MDTEKMKQDLGGGNVFEVGEPNTAFAQYFIGQSYLKMLTTERVGIGNVTFEPGCQTLARRGTGLMVPASCYRGAGRRSIQ